MPDLVSNDALEQEASSYVQDIDKNYKHLKKIFEQQNELFNKFINIFSIPLLFKDKGKTIVMIVSILTALVGICVVSYIVVIWSSFTRTYIADRVTILLCIIAIIVINKVKHKIVL